MEFMNYIMIYIMDTRMHCTYNYSHWIFNIVWIMWLSAVLLSYIGNERVASLL